MSCLNWSARYWFWCASLDTGCRSRFCPVKTGPTVGAWWMTNEAPFPKSCITWYDRKLVVVARFLVFMCCDSQTRCLYLYTLVWPPRRRGERDFEQRDVTVWNLDYPFATWPKLTRIILFLRQFPTKPTRTKHDQPRCLRTIPRAIVWLCGGSTAALSPSQHSMNAPR